MTKFVLDPAFKGVAVVLIIVGLLNWGYAAIRAIRGVPFSDSLVLFIGGLVCFTLVLLLGTVGARKP
jgi:hypothetical protein